MDGVASKQELQDPTCVIHTTTRHPAFPQRILKDHNILILVAVGLLLSLYIIFFVCTCNLMN